MLVYVMLFLRNVIPCYYVSNCYALHYKSAIMLVLFSFLKQSSLYVKRYVILCYAMFKMLCNVNMFYFVIVLYYVILLHVCNTCSKYYVMSSRPIELDQQTKLCTFITTDRVVEWIESSPHNRKVAGSSPDRAKQKALKSILVV